MNELEDLESRILRLIKCNNLPLPGKDSSLPLIKDDDLDAYELGFSWALYFVLEVITELKKKQNESCNKTK